MAIKIYNTQIAPTTEVGDVKSTRAMRIGLDTAAAPGRAMGNMLASGEKLYVKYEERKSKNSALKAYDVAVNGNENFEGLNQAKVKAGLMTDPDKAAAYYQAEYDKIKGYLENNVDGIFGKRFFNEKLAVAKISDMNTVKKNSYLNFITETRTVELKSMEPDIFKAATSQEGSVEHKIATDNLIKKFASPEFKELFGAKAKMIEFQTWEGVDVLKIGADLSKDPIRTLDNFNNNVYKNLSAETKIKLQSKIELAAQQKISSDLKEDEVRASLGLEPQFNANEYLKVFEGFESYDAIKLQIDINDKVRGAIQQVHTAKEEDLSNIKFYKLEGSGAEILAKRKANTIIRSAIEQRQTAINNGDAAGYISKIDPNIIALDEKISTSQDANTQKELIKEKKLLLDQKFNELNIPLNKRFYMSQSQAQSIVGNIKDAERWEEQEQILNGIEELYGKEDMPDIIRHLALEGMPLANQISLSTNDPNLKKDILASGKTKDLEQIIKANNIDIKKLRNKISDNLDDFEETIYNQPEGKISKQEYIDGLQETLYKAVLIRTSKTGDLDNSIKSVTQEFLRDYVISDNKTFFIPRDVNGTSVSVGAVKIKAEAIQLAVEQGNYLDRFHNNDYKHYATMADENDLSDEVVKNNIKKSIQKHSKWLLNDTSTGIVLYFDSANGVMPVVNSEGKKIEFLFLNSEFIEPETNAELPVLPDQNFGLNEYDG